MLHVLVILAQHDDNWHHDKLMRGCVECFLSRLQANQRTSTRLQQLDMHIVLSNAQMHNLLVGCPSKCQPAQVVHRKVMQDVLGILVLAC